MNPSGKRKDGTVPVVHGAYRARRRHCDACGTEYTAHRLTSRFCSDSCRVQNGQWSFKVAHQTNRRVFGVTGE